VINRLRSKLHGAVKQINRFAIILHEWYPEQIAAEMAFGMP
jgi:hypothetical protein